MKQFSGSVSIWVIASLLLCFLTSCSSLQVDTTDSTAFKQGNYRTYSWLGAAIENTAGSTDPLYTLDPTLRAAVDSKLAAKGYERVESGGDFIIDYQFKDALVSGSLNSTASIADNRYPAPTNDAIINRRADQALVDNAYALSGPKEVNSILLRFSDGDSLTMVWAAGMSKVVDKLYFDAKEMEKTINTSVSRALARLPAAN